MARFIANSDYEVIDRAPLLLEPGELVRVGRPDEDWPGWTWVTTVTGRGSYVPDDLLDKRPDGSASLLSPFQARDLSVKRGEFVESLREVQGWHWCSNSRNEEGWLPAYLLRPA